jgi:protoheme IX farnesyltransferase
MKYSASSPLARLALALFGLVVLLTVVGRAVTLAGAGPACTAWVLCPPLSQLGWLKLLHVGLAAAAAVLVLLLFFRTWREHRNDRVLLPLTTVTAVLFFGQALVGAVQVLRGLPLHLVALHTFTAVALWFSVAALMLISGLPGRADRAEPAARLRERSRDFLTLTKPLIVALLLVTTLAGLIAGGKAWPSPALAFWTLLGGALAAGGSSALNQYIDRELDKNMQRTAKRPIAAGRLTPAEGLAFGLGLCMASYYILAGMVNFLAALLSLAGIFYYVIFYSVWLKRATVQNIVIGGGAGAIPPMVGWAAATGNLNLAAWILFAIVFMWTPPHFWALAIVRMKDYANAGVPMLPVVRGEREARWQILLYTLALVGITLLLPLFRFTGTIYLVSALVLGGLLIAAAWRVWTVPGNKVAWTMYRWSSMYLALLFIALIFDSLAMKSG